MFLSAARTVPGTFFNGSVEFCGVLQFPFRFHFLSEKNDTDRAVYCPSQCLRKPARWRSEGDAYRSSKCEGRGTGIVNSRYADRELAQGAAVAPSSPPRSPCFPFRPAVPIPGACLCRFFCACGMACGLALACEIPAVCVYVCTLSKF